MRSCSPTTAMSVGTRNVPWAFIMSRASSSRKVPCSIEFTPARIARFAASAPEHAPAFLSPPAEGVLTQRFGQATSDGQRSDGVAWRTGLGAAVRAPAAGVVEYSGALKGWSGVLIMDVGGGYHLVLAGLDTLSAVPGRPVVAGEAVGRMADRGSLPPELYMEVRREGAPQDPGRWFRPSPNAPAGGRH